jgi:hypothetical protein
VAVTAPSTVGIRGQNEPAPVRKEREGAFKSDEGKPSRDGKASTAAEPELDLAKYESVIKMAESDKASDKASADMGANKRFKFTDAAAPANKSVQLSAPSVQADKTAKPFPGITAPVSAVVPTLRFPPTVFRQANIDGFARIIGSVRPFLPPKARVVELYGGVGTIGLHLVDSVEYLVCSDENPHNLRCFQASVAALPASVRAG